MQSFHELEISAVFKELNSSEKGLSKEDAKNRLKLFGPNALALKNSQTILAIFLRQLRNPIVYVLLVSTCLAFFLGKMGDGVVVFSVVILNTLIGFFQEYKAHKTIKALSSMVPDRTSVIRSGIVKLVDSTDIVPGDIVMLQAGDRIAADLRIFSLKNLQCDESALTGESIAVSKQVEAVSLDTPIVDRKCMAFSGSYVTCGTGLGIVVATGLRTEFGKIAELIEQAKEAETPLSMNIRQIARWITFSVIVASLGLFLIGYFRGIKVFDAAFAAISLAVAAVPEGLPAIITIASSVGVRRMAYKQAIIRQLPAVEALGSTNIICTDKTGTLTYNEMTVQKIWTKSGTCFISGAGYCLEGDVSFSEKMNIEEVKNLLIAAALCSDATIDESIDGSLPVGDPTEIALVVAARKMGLLETSLRAQWQRKDLIPFDSQIRLMATLNVSSSTEHCIFIKGAPEEILSVCKDVTNLDEIQTQIQSMAKNGMRILGIAKKEVGSDFLHLRETDIQSGFLFLGLIGMIDPPRKEVYQALKSCHQAGINVKMITGDHPLTAEAIARDLGILGSSEVLTGLALSKLDLDSWKEAAVKTQVFARVLPEHKLKLVEVFQDLGYVVAMTGDGVNDAPALKQADIGVAMGTKGTAVAKESADMILADDNFANIEAAVEEGRRVYDNLIKSFVFVLGTSLGLALIVLLAILFFPIYNGDLLQPMLPVQILWVNLVVAVALSLPLAFESPESDIMKRPPRKKQTPILNRLLITKMVSVSFAMALGSIGLFLWEYNSQLLKGNLIEKALSEAQTMAVTSMILFQIFYLFNCRSLSDSIFRKEFFSNFSVFIGVFTVLIAHAFFVYSPFMNRLFKTSPIDLKAWLLSTLSAFLIVPIIALERVIRQWYLKKCPKK